MEFHWICIELSMEFHGKFHEFTERFSPGWRDLMTCWLTSLSFLIRLWMTTFIFIILVSKCALKNKVYCVKVLFPTPSSYFYGQLCILNETVSKLSTSCTAPCSNCLFQRGIPSLWRNRLEALTADQKVWGSILTRAKAKWCCFLRLFWWFRVVRPSSINWFAGVSIMWPAAHNMLRCLWA
jgi:hypothetical protein